MPPPPPESGYHTEHHPADVVGLGVIFGISGAALVHTTHELYRMWRDGIFRL